MSIVLIGKKLGMTQVFNADNTLVAVTVVEAGPCPVTQVKTAQSDGYEAVQIGFGAQKESRMTKSELGHLKKAGVEPLTELVEIRTDKPSELKIGDVLKVTNFQEGQKVDIIGTSKGKGFQGVMRRHNFQGQPASHGHMMHRRPGSVGCRQTPGHVYKGRKMPGHQGQVRCTTQNLSIVKILEDKNLLLIKGSIPGANGDIVLVRTAKKA
ncbi:50S ribosomal protein L3 [Intestinicryptomonas porci]|uniref:Large ribosomal subunit protein uL3 n=1 Tax=Intestinicryptomonas porci TaxID=2926320 RepID=A0ABU4WDG1_9BACT|nr:50S ribosomal protein L3 [Opitutales bacterium]MDX8414591.1 50S ribosomal protein L3 [Opitutales bacterium CLA-KB-P66]